MLFVRRPLPFPQEALLYGRRRRPFQFAVRRLFYPPHRSLVFLSSAFSHTKYAKKGTLFVLNR